MTYDPAKETLYKSRNDRKDAALEPGEMPARTGWDAEPDADIINLETETPQQRYDRMRVSYNAALKRRISTGSIGSEHITYTPTLRNRDRAFELQGRETIIKALKQIGYEEKEMLERFVGNAEAMADLLRHGKMPDGLTDHWRHPIRGGGSQDLRNVCIMTVEAHTALRDCRLYPAIHQAYAGEWPGIKIAASRRGYGNATNIVQLENYATDNMIESGSRRISSQFIRTIEIGYPTGGVVLSDVDFDLRDDLVALRQQAELNDAARQRLPNRDSRVNHLPAPPHARQARPAGPRR